MRLCDRLAGGWGVRCRIPLMELGKLSMPTHTIRYFGGYVRLGIDRARNQLVATLEDKQGHAISKPTRLDAIRESYAMGRAICAHLADFNKQYAVGMETT